MHGIPSGCNRIGATHPVVALRLPPANVYNASGVCVLRVFAVNSLPFDLFPLDAFPYPPIYATSPCSGFNRKRYKNRETPEFTAVPIDFSAKSGIIGAESESTKEPGVKGGSEVSA